MSASFTLKYIYSEKLTGETVNAYLSIRYSKLHIDHNNNNLCIKKEENNCIYISVRKDRIDFFSTVSQDCMRKCKRFLYIPYTYFRLSGKKNRHEFLHEVMEYLRLRFGE